MEQKVANLRFNLPSAAAVFHDGILNVGGVGVEESVARVWILVLGLKNEAIVNSSSYIYQSLLPSYSTLIHR